MKASDRNLCKLRNLFKESADNFKQEFIKEFQRFQSPNSLHINVLF